MIPIRDTDTIDRSTRSRGWLFSISEASTDLWRDMGNGCSINQLRGMEDFHCPWLQHIYRVVT